MKHLVQPCRFYFIFRGPYNFCQSDWKLTGLKFKNENHHFSTLVHILTDINIYQNIKGKTLLLFHGTKDSEASFF